MQLKPQCLGESVEYLQGRIGYPALQLRNIGPVDLGGQGERFLREVGALPCCLDLFRQVSAQFVECLIFHARQNERGEIINPRNIVDKLFHRCIIEHSRNTLAPWARLAGVAAISRSQYRCYPSAKPMEPPPFVMKGSNLPARSGKRARLLLSVKGHNDGSLRSSHMG